MAIKYPLLVALEIVYRAIYPSLLSTPNTINAIKDFLKENPQYNEIALEIATIANTVMSNEIKSHNHSPK